MGLLNILLFFLLSHLQGVWYEFMFCLHLVFDDCKCSYFFLIVHIAMGLKCAL